MSLTYQGKREKWFNKYLCELIMTRGLVKTEEIEKMLPRRKKVMVTLRFNNTVATLKEIVLSGCRVY